MAKPHRGMGGGLKVKTTIRGQGGGIPRENTWSNHALIHYNGVIYDPSYGVSYGIKNVAKQNFIHQLDSVGYFIFSTGTPADSLGYGFVYVVRKNTPRITEKDILFSW